MAASYFKTRKDDLDDLNQYEVEKKSSNIEGIKYFDAYQEVLAPDELMEYKGVHFKFAMNASRFTNLYGRIKVKNTNNLEKALYQADLGGEQHYRAKSTSQAFCKQTLVNKLRPLLAAQSALSQPYEPHLDSLPGDT